MTVKERDYTNLFEEAGYSPDAIDSKVEETWHHLFEGPHKIYFDSDQDTGYMLDTGNNDARSEGMSYGMMMAVQMDRQDIFDRLWKWSKIHMYMTEGTHKGYFAWSCRRDGKKNAYGPAPDGEEYFAMALFFASGRWGDREAPFDYSVQARDILGCCLHNEYPMWDRTNHLIKFIPEVDFTDPSYHLPHFYDLFAERAHEEDRTFWSEAAQASRKYLPGTCHPETGFAPEYSYYDGTAHPHFNKSHMDFYSDAYRVAANIGLDAEWFGPRPWQKEIIDRIHRFFRDKNPAHYAAYTLDGSPLERDYVHNIGLLATNAMGALATDTEASLDTVRTFWKTPPRTDERRYYDNCLYFFAILALSGRFRMY